MVCDVSGKNPNVMFELGMRLAFDKPTIIVKDDKTTYTFDTAPIEHLEYPRDLRFAKIVEFQESLSSKIEATHKKAQTDKNYTTFLKNFGSFSVAKLENRTLDKNDFILEELRSLKSLVLRQPRVNEESLRSPVIDRAAMTSDFVRWLRHAVAKAAVRLVKRKSRRDFSKLVMEEVLAQNPQLIGNYFRTEPEFHKQIELELRRQGLAL